MSASVDGETEGHGGQRALERPDVVDEANLGVDRRHVADPDDHDDLVAHEPDRVDGMVEERPAVDRFAQLVATEPGRPATGQDDAGDARGHRGGGAGRGGLRTRDDGHRAYGAGRHAGRGPRGSPSRTCGSCRSRRDRRPASAGRGAAIASAVAVSSRVRGGGVGEVGVEAGRSDRPVRAGEAPRAGTRRLVPPSARGGGDDVARARFETVHRGGQGRVRGRGRVASATTDEVAGTDQASGTDQPVEDRAASRDPGSSRRTVATRRIERAMAARAVAEGASVATASSAAAAAAAATSGASATTPLTTLTPCRSSRVVRRAARSRASMAAIVAVIRAVVARRREMPAWRVHVEDEPADDQVGAAGPADQETVAGTERDGFGSCGSARSRGRRRGRRRRGRPAPPSHRPRPSRRAGDPSRDRPSGAPRTTSARLVATTSGSAVST